MFRHATYCAYLGCRKALSCSCHVGKDSRFYCDPKCATRGIRYNEEIARADEEKHRKVAFHKWLYEESGT